MRNYKCTTRRMGTYEVQAMHAFDALKKAAAYWGVDRSSVVVTLDDPRPAMYADKGSLVQSLG